mgnify:CR=1 FL=1
MIRFAMTGVKLEFVAKLLGLDIVYFARGAFWLGFGLLLTFLAGIALSSLFSRILSKEIFGQYSFLVAALGFVSITALPGIPAIVSQAASERKDGVLQDAMFMVFRWSLVGMIVLLLMALYFTRENPSLALALALSGVAFPISSAFGLYGPYLTGKKRFKDVAIFTTIGQYVTLVATAVALFWLPNLVTIALFSVWSTVIVNLLLSAWALKGAENQRRDLKLLSFGKHLSFSQILPTASEYLDRFLIPFLLGFGNLAIYSFAILIPTQLHYFLKTFIQLSQPKIAQMSTREIKRNLLDKTLQLELLIILVVLAYIILSPFIFDILYPNYKKDSLLLSQTFVLSLLYFPTNMLSLAKIKARATSIIYKSNSSVALISMLLLLVMVPIWGLWGAILAKVLGKTLQGIIQIYFFKKLYSQLS